jgi:hypothetical protein
MSFDPDCDDLHDWFFVSFIEEWQMNSAERDKEDLERLNLVCCRTDKFIDWCLENMDTACDYKMAKRFAMAILNTIDIDGIMAQMDGWRFRTTCDNCKRCMVDCECEGETG